MVNVVLLATEISLFRFLLIHFCCLDIEYVHNSSRVMSVRVSVCTMDKQTHSMRHWLEYVNYPQHRRIRNMRK